jgi:hypothetical protein
MEGAEEEEKKERRKGGREERRGGEKGYLDTPIVEGKQNGKVREYGNDGPLSEPTGSVFRFF